MKRFPPKRHLLNMSDFDSWMSCKTHQLESFDCFPYEDQKNTANDFYIQIQTQNSK